MFTTVGSYYALLYFLQSCLYYIFITKKYCQSHKIIHYLLNMLSVSEFLFLFCRYLSPSLTQMILCHCFYCHVASKVEKKCDDDDQPKIVLIHPVGLRLAGLELSNINICNPNNMKILVNIYFPLSY